MNPKLGKLIPPPALSGFLKGHCVPDLLNNLSSHSTGYCFGMVRGCFFLLLEWHKNKFVNSY